MNFPPLASYRRALLVILGTIIHSSALAVDVQFMIVDNESKELLNDGHLEDGSVFLSELYEAGLYLGKRVDSEETINIGISVRHSFGGTAIASPRIGSTSEVQYDGQLVSVMQPAAVEYLESPGEQSLCEPHMDVAFDTYLLYDQAEHKIYYPPGTTRGITFHEIAHGLGFTSLRINGEEFLAENPDGIRREDGVINTDLMAFDLLINRIEGENNEFEVGGNFVEQVYGRKVRLQEYFQRGNFSHIGQSSSHTIRSDGVFKPNTTSSIFGELGNIDVGTSVLSASNSYISPVFFTPIDIALLKDLGYPMAPLNATIYFNSNAREDNFLNEFTKTMYIPFLRLSGDNDRLYSLHLMWESGSRFSSLGIATTGEVGFLQLAGGAAEVLNSPIAVLDGSNLHIPNIEVYEDGQVSHVSADLVLASESAPFKFDLVNLQPTASNTSNPKVEFIHCE